MSGRGRRRSTTSFPREPPSIPKEQLIQVYGNQFKVHSIVKSNYLFKVDVGDTSFSGQPLTAIECHSYEQVDECFRRAQQSSSETFQPIAAYKNDEKFLLLVNFTGETFVVWAANNAKTIWNSSGELSNDVVNIGKELFKIVSNHHKNDNYLGYIREELCISEDNRLVFIPNYSVPSFDDNSSTGRLRKDLLDLRWFISTLDEQAKTPNHEQCQRFLSLFPNNFSHLFDVEKLKELSYIICKNPMFWGLNERYQFAKIVKRDVYDKKKTFDDKMFYLCIPIDGGLTDVGNWFDDVKASNPNGVVLKSYNYGRGRDKCYSKNRGILAFLRNTFEHYQEWDPMMTREGVDREIIRLFPNIYEKIYLAIANPNVDNLIPLAGLLEKMM